MNKTILSTVALTSAYLFMASPVMASNSTVTCTPIYGGGQNCQTDQLIINKTVMNPANNTFVDNLTANDPKYTAGANAFFKISVKNTGTTEIKDATVKDIFPQLVDFASGPGSFDAGSKTLTFKVTLKPGEEKVFTIIGRVSNDIATGTTCVTNESFVTFNDVTNQDNAQLCIEKTVVTTPVPPTTITNVVPAPQLKYTPATGPELLPIVASALSGMAGLVIRKKAFK